MNAIPLPKSLFDRAMKQGVSSITLEFSGGSDEGLLNVSILPSGVDRRQTLVEDIEVWADDAYGYSGGGCGVPYGDTVVYDLLGMKTTVTNWVMVKKESKNEPEDMEVCDDEAILE